MCTSHFCSPQVHGSLISSLPTAKISNPDVTRLINSDEIQSVVRPAGQKVQKRPWTQKKNPLVNKAILFRLNPYAKTIRRQELGASHNCYVGMNCFCSLLVWI